MLECLTQTGERAWSTSYVPPKEHSLAESQWKYIKRSLKRSFAYTEIGPKSEQTLESIQIFIYLS